MMKKKFIHSAALVVFGALLMSAMPAKAELTIAPLRVVFSGRDRSAVVSLINISDHVNTYRLGWKFYKMDERGQYKEVLLDEKDPNGVDKMVIFSPRQVVIRPDEHQLVRLSLRRPPDLPVGEYRANLTFTRLPPDFRKRNKEDDEKTKPKGQKTELMVNLSVSIPVIVRSGTENTRVEITTPKFGTVESGGVKHPVLNLDLKRVEGSFSTYGTLIVFWQRPGQKDQQVGLMNNVALYPEMKHREISIGINSERVSGGNLRVVYFGKYESKGTIWDEKIFPVGG